MSEQTNLATPRRYYNIWQQKRTAEVYIYGAITSWPLLESDVSSYDLAQEIAGLDVDVIQVYINSPGGAVSEGAAIYTALCRHKAKVITHCDGFGCSAASVIFMAGEERYINKLAQLMIHEVITDARGNAEELRQAADTVEQMSQSMAEAYRGKVNISDEELAKMLAKETWLNAEQAVNLGFATAIEYWQEDKTYAMAAQTSIYNLLAAGLQASEDPAPPNEPKPKQEKTPKNTRRFFNFKNNL